MRQESFFKIPPAFHGGETALGRRKSRRPLDRKKSLHLTLKARRRDLPRHASYLRGELNRQATKFGLTIYDLAIAHDHVHCLIKIPGRREYLAFIRTLTGILAKKLGRGLWKLLPFSRVVQWGKDFLQMKRYLQKNREETNGERPYEARRDWYARHRKNPIRSKKEEGA